MNKEEKEIETIREILKEFYKNNIEPPYFGGRRPKLFPDDVHTTIVSGKPVHFPVAPEDFLEK